MDFIAPFRLAARPLTGFHAEAGTDTSLGTAFMRMLLWRTVLGWIDGALSLWGFAAGYASFRAMEGPLWPRILEAVTQINADIRPADLKEMLAQLPALPPLGRMLLWLLPLVPLGVASAWLHNVVWDHGCLWLLRGVERNRGWRITMKAESTAMWAGSAGIALGLIGHAPVVGLLLGPVLGALGVYFWVLRGVALAAFHGCPMWKGVAATLLHVAIAVCCGCGLVFLAWQLSLSMAGGATYG
ncbi:MAG: hypothetical protein ACREMG_09590 [Gemmatimonadales bacterium]